MKRTIFLLFLLFLLPVAIFSLEIAPYLPAQKTLVAKKKLPITVQFPYENMKLPAGIKQIFVFGHIFLPNSSLDINGQTVPVDADGSFLAYVPVETGPFELLLTASNSQQTVQAVRHIKVLGTDIQNYMHKAAFDEKALFPQHEVEVLPEETLNLYARGTPKSTVYAVINGLKNAKHIPMQEDPDNPGIYRGTYTLFPDQPEKTVKVLYKMENGPDKSKAKATAPAKIKIRDTENRFTYAQINHPGIKLRQLPTPHGNLYPHYRAFGPVLITGKRNEQYRIYLNNKESAWLESGKLDIISSFPQTLNRVTGMRTETKPDKTRFTVTGVRAEPIRIEEFKDRLEITLYYVDEIDENFSLDHTSPVLDNIVWSEPEPGTLVIKIYFQKENSFWGYAYQFDETGLVIDLIHKPVLTPTPTQPLKGARILIDAGHNPKNTAPYDGAVGPTGYLEYEGTLALAEKLKQALEKEGATVILTRNGTNHLTLLQRYEHALNNQAHIFVSLHYNALPENTNPFSAPRGFSIYYTYPHSFRLAESMYQSYVKNIPLADNGMIVNDVLFIPRISEMPSILVENAYLMFANQEKMARTPKGQAQFVKALKEGIINFFKNN